MKLAKARQLINRDGVVVVEEGAAECEEVSPALGDWLGDAAGEVPLGLASVG